MSSLSVCYLVVATTVAAAAVWRPAESYHVDKYSLLMPNVRPKKVMTINVLLLLFLNSTRTPRRRNARVTIIARDRMLRYDHICNSTLYYRAREI